MIETKYKDIYVNEDDLEIYKKFASGRIAMLHKWIDNVGYYTVCFRVDGKKYYVRIHRLIASALIPNPNNLPQVNHIDGNKLNNSLNNLEWCNNKYNTKEAYNNNLYKSTYRCPIKAINKITKEEQIFESIRKCAENLKINRKTLTAILKNEHNNHYNYEFEYI